MASNSNQRSGSSGRSTGRKRVVIGAEETVRVSYGRDAPQVESQRRNRRQREHGSAGAAKSRGNSAGTKLSASKRKERERRQQVLRIRRMALGAGAALFVVAAGIGLVSLYRAPILPIKQVVVEGASHYTAEEVRQVAAVPGDATLIRVPVNEIAERLEADPWIAKAEVNRDFPSTLRLVVAERKPAAVVDSGGGETWLVSTDGHWLDPISEDVADLIAVADIPAITAQRGERISQPELLNAIEVLDGLGDTLRGWVVGVSAPSVDETALRTRRGVEIFVGQAAEMQAKDRIIVEILGREKGVVYINVRVTDRPTWRGLEEE